MTPTAKGLDMHWQADSVKAVIFTAPYGPHRDASELWVDAFPGDSPDGYQRNPSAPNLQSSASGERHGFVINIAAQIGQIAVTANPVFRQVPGLMTGAVTPPRIVEVAQAIHIVVDAMKRLVTFSQATRIAVALELAKTVPSTVTSEMFAEELPGVPFPRGSIEPSFQFNSQTPLANAPHITINRVCVWSSAQVGFFGGNVPGAQNAPLTMTNYIGFNIDVNSHPSQNLFGINVAESFDSLRVEALGIAKNRIRHFE